MLCLLRQWRRRLLPSCPKRAVLTNPYFWLMAALVLGASLCAIEPAHAADATEGGGSGLPWEGPLTKLKQSISGPVAFVIALLGIIACGATLIWGGSSEFTRRIIYVVLRSASSSSLTRC